MWMVRMSNKKFLTKEPDISSLREALLLLSKFIDERLEKKSEGHKDE